MQKVVRTDGTQSIQVKPELCSIEHFKEVLFQALAQVTPGGKGDERHGHGVLPLERQQWRSIATEVKHGRAFLEGQSRKKLTEASHFADPERYRREMLGSIVYAVFAIMQHEVEQRNTEAAKADAAKAWERMENEGGGS